jgi:hypothetical protein
MTLQRVFVTLRSARAQSPILRFGVPVRSVEADEARDRKLVTREDGKRGWRIDLPANTSIRLRGAM